MLRAIAAALWVPLALSQSHVAVDWLESPAPPDDATYAALKVEIEAPAEVKDGDTFSVETTLRNDGATEVRLGIWSCSYAQHWEIQEDGPQYVQTGYWVCFRNGLGVVTLEAGEAYKRELKLQVMSAGQVDKVVFRLGFQPWTANPRGGPVHNTIIWSGPVAVQVKGS